METNGAENTGLDSFINKRMLTESSDLNARVAKLERDVRRAYGVAAVAALVALGLGTTGFLRLTQAPDVIRTRQLIIEDQAGRERVILGAPIRDNFQRVSPATGMVVRDSAGRERFGLSLDGRGNMGLGLDAPQCTSDPCNTERINLVADAAGGSHIRLLDRQTGVAARLYLDEDDKAYLAFLKVTRDSIRERRMGLAGDTASARSRR